MSLELLSDHYEGCRAEIVSLMQSNERLLNLSILVLGGVVTYGVAGKVAQLVVVAPLAIAIVMLQGLQRYQLVHQLGGYKKYLEERMNAELGHRVVFWEELCASLYHSSWTHYPLRILYSLAALLCVNQGLLALNAILARSKVSNPSLWWWGYVILLVLIAATVLASFRRFRASFNLAYEAARKMGEIALPGPRI